MWRPYRHAEQREASVTVGPVVQLNTINMNDAGRPEPITTRQAPDRAISKLPPEPQESPQRHSLAG